MFQSIQAVSQSYDKTRELNPNAKQKGPVDNAIVYLGGQTESRFLYIRGHFQRVY